MNVRYLGDQNDFAKYDLLLYLALSRGSPRAVTVIPMLTPAAGQKSYPAGNRDPELLATLRALREAPGSMYPAAMRRLRTFYREHGVDFRVVPDGLFTLHSRENYLNPASLALSEGVVFIDPDTGMEVPHGRGIEHLRYGELERLWCAMSGSSVLVVYQHRQRRPLESTFADIVQRLAVETGSVGRISSKTSRRVFF